MIGKQVRKHRINTATSYLQSSEQGFTIIESLVAILVVGILLVAIAPVLSLSVATRVQSRRVELASQAARSYIDGVRAKTIDPPAAITVDIDDFNAPTPSGNIACDNSSYCTLTSTSTSNTPTNLYCIDFDALPQSSTDPPKCQTSSAVDMVIQVFRYNQTSGSTASSGYSLGVRVYRANAFKSGITLKASKDANPSDTSLKKQRTFAEGSGLSSIQLPLVEMTADISDTVPKYSDLCARITGGCTN